MIALLPLLATGSVSEVRICGLINLWENGVTAQTSGFKHLAILQATLQDINSRSDLLPQTTLKLQQDNGGCDRLTATASTARLMSSGFNGAGCDLLIGAACSGASMGAAAVASMQSLPQISYASTSPELSDSSDYPFFARTPVSDTLQAATLVGVVRHVLNFTRLATLSSDSAYGRGGVAAVHAAARLEEIDVLAEPTFPLGATEAQLRAPGGPIEAVRASGARVILLFCHNSDAPTVMSAARAAGIGGEGYTWIGSEDVGLIEDATWYDTHAAALNGRFGLISVRPAAASTPAQQAYSTMAAGLPSHEGNGSANGCDFETDDGGALMWAREVSSGSYACGGAAVQTGTAYGPFIYDAALAAAHALHELIEVQGVSALRGAQLYDAILNVSFDGATGPISFNRNPAGQAFRGDRQVGARYEVCATSTPAPEFGRSHHIWPRGPT